MKVTTNLNGNTKVTSYGNKFYYRDTPNGAFTQVKRGFYRDTPNGNFVQFYLFDETAPTISITSSSASTVRSTYNFTANVTDTESGLAAISVNGVGCTVTSGSTSYTVSLNFGLSLGNNYFTIVATDTAGNTSQQTINVIRVNAEIPANSVGASQRITYSGDSHCHSENDGYTVSPRDPQHCYSTATVRVNFADINSVVSVDGCKKIDVFVYVGCEPWHYSGFSTNYDRGWSSNYASRISRISAEKQYESTMAIYDGRQHRIHVVKMTFNVSALSYNELKQCYIDITIRGQDQAYATIGGSSGSEDGYSGAGTMGTVILYGEL